MMNIYDMNSVFLKMLINQYEFIVYLSSDLVILAIVY